MNRLYLIHFFLFFSFSFFPTFFGGVPIIVYDHHWLESHCIAELNWSNVGRKGCHPIPVSIPIPCKFGILLQVGRLNPSRNVPSTLSGGQIWRIPTPEHFFVVRKSYWTYSIAGSASCQYRTRKRLPCLQSVIVKPVLSGFGSTSGNQAMFLR